MIFGKVRRVLLIFYAECLYLFDFFWGEAGRCFIPSFLLFSSVDPVHTFIHSLFKEEVNGLVNQTQAIIEQSKLFISKSIQHIAVNRYSSSLLITFWTSNTYFQTSKR